jgi:tetratricopeptide (TPR) repeat protein
MSEGNLRASPYKGLVPYSEEDAPFFFGRDQKREIITANLMASRLTLLHGPSGVGKSSVLRAGVTYNLHKLAERNLAEGRNPDFAVIVFNSWRDDPVLGLATAVRETVAKLLNGPTLDPLPPSRELTRCLQTWTRQDPKGNLPNLDLFIILDQFEEYFLYHPTEAGDGTFASELPRAINSSDLRVNFLISVREDQLARLERFKASIPHLFENRLSLEHLDQESAREAITRPIEQYNLSYPGNGTPVEIESSLVDAVLDQVKTGQVVFGPAGGAIDGADNAPDKDTRIETPFLQMVMTRLWEEEMSGGSRVLRLATLNGLGGAERIVRTHLDNTMGGLSPNQQEIASRIFYHLVTPSGTKIAHTVPDLAAFAGLQPEELNPVLVKLADNTERILRPAEPPPNRRSVQRYEIFHDVLAPAILDWRTRFLQAQEQSETERKAERNRKRANEQARIARRLRWLTGALLVLFLAAVAFAIYAAAKKRQAEAAERTAQASKQTAQASERTAQDALAALKQETYGRESAEAALREKADIFRQEADILRTDLAADELQMQHVYEGALSKYDELLGYYQKAQEGLRQKNPNTTNEEKELLKQYRLGEANTYVNIGCIYYEDGNAKKAQACDAAISCYEQALKIKTEELGENHQDVAPVWKAMADAYHASRDNTKRDDTKALTCINKALDIYANNPRFRQDKSPVKDAEETRKRIQNNIP